MQVIFLFSSHLHLSILDCLALQAFLLYVSLISVAAVTKSLLSSFLSHASHRPGLGLDKDKAYDVMPLAPVFHLHIDVIH